MYTYIYLHIQIIHTYEHTYIYIQTHIYTYIQIHANTHRYMHVRTHTYAYIFLPYGLRHRRIKVFCRYRQRPLRHLTFSDRRGPYGRPSAVAADYSVAETV